MIPEPFFLWLGQIVFYLGILVFLIAVILALLIAYSFKTERFLFPNFMLSTIALLENFVKGIFRFAGVEDSIVDDVGIQLKNKVSLKKFEKAPYESRIVFFPQCLRSIDCPSKLSPEGIQCINCGRCEVGAAKRIAEGLGYRAFIVPGSSFIKRVVRKYKPEVILGVGCRSEIKNGLDMCQNFGVPGVGITLSRAGCVSTILDWDRFYEILNLRQG